MAIRNLLTRGIGFTPGSVKFLVLHGLGGSVGTTGTLAKTNANDTLAASGSPVVSGALAKTNANDSIAASGTSTVTGTLAKTNANDTCVASGSVGSAVTGTVNYTNANDTLVASGTSTVNGSLSKTNANDTLAASGNSTITGTVAKTNNNDSCVASGYVGGAVTGTVNYTNRNDTLNATGTSGNSAPQSNSGKAKKLKEFKSIYSIQENAKAAPIPEVIKDAEVDKKQTVQLVKPVIKPTITTTPIVLKLVPSDISKFSGYTRQDVKPETVEEIISTIQNKIKLEGGIQDENKADLLTAMNALDEIDAEDAVYAILSLIEAGAL
jgi:hypothetical protein